MMAHQLRRKRGASLTSVTYQANATSTTSSLTLPTVLAGDVCLFYDNAVNTKSTTIPTLVTPSGFTSIGSATHVIDNGGTNSDYGMRAALSYKILSSGDSNTSVTGMSGSATNKFAAIFRGNVAIASVITNDVSLLYTDKSISSGSTSSLPVICFCCCSGQEVTISTTLTLLAGASGYTGYTFSYDIYNTSPSNEVASVGYNTINGYLTFT